MNISIASYSFHGLHGAGMMNIFGYIESIKHRYRLDTADIWSGMIGTTDSGVIGKVSTAIEEAELGVSNYHIDEACVWNPDPDIRECNYQILLQHLDVAEKLGASTVRIDFGGRDSEMSNEQFDVLVKRYSEFARRAADNGYRIGPETHYGPALVLDNMKRVLEAVDNPAYGILLHIGHWVPGEEDDGDRWAAPHTMHTHVDARITSTCLVDKMKLLMNSGYTGYWGVEHHSAQNEHAEVAWQLATVRRVLATL
ncbi:MAG TPA: TIM barrel protein [Capsulimonadaceae bacterium]|jgi:sugar phosphate isomerase/epimerase